MCVTEGSQAYRILVDLITRLAALLEQTVDRDRRYSWVIDGTLVRDHSTAAKSKNYRWCCKPQALARRTDLKVVAISGGGPESVCYRDSEVEALCRLVVIRAVAFLHNLRIELRDVS